LPAVMVVAVLAPLRSAVADWNDVPSGSMMPTILAGDRIFINKLAYDLKVPFTTWHVAKWGDPQRGDIIIFPSPADGIRLVKRVVAVPGDRLELRNDRLFINDQPAAYQPMYGGAQTDAVFRETVSGRAHEMMIQPEKTAWRTFGPIEVPPGRYFVMGDNRDNSFDSRYFGFVPRDSILGRATNVAMSFDREHYFKPRFGRFGSSLP
jgi:signal peptidase I